MCPTHCVDLKIYKKKSNEFTLPVDFISTVQFAVQTPSSFKVLTKFGNPKIIPVNKYPSSINVMKLIILTKPILYYKKLNSLVGGSIYSLTQSKKILVEKKQRKMVLTLKESRLPKCAERDMPSGGD